jgi:monooxygenase
LSAPACPGSARPVISVVTDEIAIFTETGLRLASGEELEADIIVTATGLKKWLTGGISINVAGTPFDVGNATAYKGVIFSDVPNLAAVFGYANASWTLTSDLIADDYVCRLQTHMDRHRYPVSRPRKGEATVTEDPTLPLTSG